MASFPKAFLFLQVLCLTLVSFQFVNSSLHSSTDRDEVMKKLSEMIAESQIQKTIPLDFPFSFYKQKGVYSSNIHTAFFGPPDETFIRRTFKVFDNNVFVTIWITSLLLEVSRCEGPDASDDQISSALEAIGTYHDKNYNNSIVAFWTQSYNASTDTWVCGPVNMDELAHYGLKDEKYIGALLKILGLEKYWDKIKPTIDSMLTATNAFVIPADFDDTFLNLGLGSLLKTSGDSIYQLWLKSNPNISDVINALKKYAYRPFSNDFNSRSIDPRTYFYIRNFLKEAQPLGNLAIATTWIENINESIANYNNSYRMPFGVNNVDLTVCSNVLYGLTAAVLSELGEEGAGPTWFDEDVQMIYRNTSALVLYEIANNFSSRPDLSLTYYPSVFNFYWFTSRVYNLLNTVDDLPFPVLSDVHEEFDKTLKGAGTLDIVNRVTVEKDYVYFDDFLGDNDTNIFGKTVNHGDDRICSTAMAVNMLFYTWSKGSAMSSDVPAAVNEILKGACKWLTEYSISEKYYPMNTFFSGSIKMAPEDFPLIFPANFMQRANGSSVSPDTHYFDDIITAVSGLIPEEQYQNMLKETHFGYPVPIDFHGYNSKYSPFPFWSSDAFTYAASLLALSQCRVYGF